MTLTEGPGRYLHVVLMVNSMIMIISYNPKRTEYFWHVQALCQVYPEHAMPQL